MRVEVEHFDALDLHRYERAGRVPYPHLRLGNARRAALNNAPFSILRNISPSAWWSATGTLTAKGAASFASASSQYLSRASSSSLQTGNVDWWFSAVLNATTLDAFNVVAAKFGTGNTNSDFSVYFSSGTPNCQIFNGSTSKQATWGSSLSTGTTYHLFGWFDSVSQTVNISINNGTPVSTSTAGFTPITSTSALLIGASGTTPANFWNGTLAAVIFGKSPVGGIASGTNSAANIRAALYNSANFLAACDITAAQQTAWGTIYGYDYKSSANLLNDSIGNNTLTNNGVTFALGTVATHTLANGDAVQTEGDASGNNNSATSATASDWPIYTTGVIAGKPIIRFTAANSNKLFKAFTLNQPCTIIFVGKAPTASGTIFDGSAAKAKLYEATTWKMDAGTVLDSGINSDTNAHVFAAVFNGANSFLVVDGTQGTIGNAGSNNPGGVTLASVLAGGSYNSLDQYDVVVAPSALTLSQIANVRAIEKGQWSTLT